MALFRAIFAYVIKNFEMRSFWIIQMGPNSNDASYKRQKRRRHGKAEDHVKTEAKIRILQPQAKDHLEPSEAGRGQEGISPSDFSGSIAPLNP